MTPGEPVAADETLGFMLVDAARLLRRHFETRLEAAGLGLTAGEARTLFYTAAFAPIRQSALAERMAVEPMTLVGFLDRLERAGLVERSTDPVDRRAKLVRPTPAAAEPLARMSEIGRQARLQATAGLDDASVEQLHKALRKIRGNLDGVDAIPVVGRPPS